MRTIVYIFAGFFCFTACGASTTDEAEDQILYQSVLAEWDNMEPVAREIICDVYIERGRDDQEGFAEQIAAGGDSIEYATMKVVVMEEEC